MTFDDAALVLIRYVVPLAVSAVAALAIGIHWRAKQIHERAAREHYEAIDLIRVAQDPGRDIQFRLAAAMEADIIRHGEGVGPDPAGRRLAAIAMATKIIETARRANLTITPADAPEEE